MSTCVVVKARASAPPCVFPRLWSVAGCDSFGEGLFSRRHGTGIPKNRTAVSEGPYLFSGESWPVVYKKKKLLTVCLPETIFNRMCKGLTGALILRRLLAQLRRCLWALRHRAARVHRRERDIYFLYFFFTFYSCFWCTECPGPALLKRSGPVCFVVDCLRYLMQLLD